MNEETPQQTVSPENTETANTETHGPKIKIAKKTLILILILALITIGLLWAAFLPKKQAPVQTALPTITPDPIQTVLTISTAPIPLATPSSYKTDVVINTGQNKITSVQLELSYDPEILTNVDIVPGRFFTDPEVSLKKIDQALGRISFALKAPGPSNTDNGILGQGIIATVKFSAKNPKQTTTTSIDFLPKTQVNAEGITQSVLKSTVGTQFTLSAVLAPTATPSAKIQ